MVGIPAESGKRHSVFPGSRVPDLVARQVPLHSLDAGLRIRITRVRPTWSTNLAYLDFVVGMPLKKVLIRTRTPTENVAALETSNRRLTMINRECKWLDTGEWSTCSCSRLHSGNMCVGSLCKFVDHRRQRAHHQFQYSPCLPLGGQPYPSSPELLNQTQSRNGKNRQVLTS